jgi:hypothetical protein
VKKSSLHYKITSSYHYIPNEISLCQYVRMFIFSCFIHTFVCLLLLTWFSLSFLVPVYYIFISSNTISVGLFFITTIAFVLNGHILLQVYGEIIDIDDTKWYNWPISYFFSFIIKKEDIEYSNKTPREIGLVSLYFKSFKDKICPFIKFED